MVLSDFLTETRRRWLKAFKLFKRIKSRKPRNRVSPALVRSPSYSGTVDARAEIDLQQFCASHTPRASHTPPLPPEKESDSYYSSYNSFGSSRVGSLDSTGDSAYDSARSSPRARVCYATVTYFNVNDSEDSSSVLTECTLLDDADAPPHHDTSPPHHDVERAQNLINESLELVSTL